MPHRAARTPGEEVTIETANSILGNAANDENLRAFDRAVVLALQHMRVQIDKLSQHMYQQETVCPSCGSLDIQGYEEESFSGVTGPNGEREVRWQRGFRCRVCGSVEED